MSNVIQLDDHNKPILICPICKSREFSVVFSGTIASQIVCVGECFGSTVIDLRTKTNLPTT